MVEFGLKLEDNKIKKWSTHYLDYEGLKKLLKRCKAAMKAREDYLKKHPDAQNQALLNGSCISTQEANSNNDKNNNKPEQPVAPVGQPNEQTSLLKAGQAIPKNSSHVSLVSLNSNFNGTTTTMRRTFSLSNLFGGGDPAQQYADIVATCNARHETFNNALKLELEKVNTFYLQEFQDVSERFDYLEQSVVDAALAVQDGNGHNCAAGDDNVPSYVSTCIRSKNLRSSIMDWAARAKKKRNPSRRVSVVHVLGLVDDGSESEHEDGYEGHMELKEADSIRRSLVDLYRGLKLLSNYTVINYTGFVKIIKKHDKMLPEFKGQLAIFLDETVFHRNKPIELLINRMEKVYADWFCFGNIREAQSKMLPKQGDILEMDWTQLRLGYRLGMAAILTIWVCWDCVWGSVKDGNSTIGGREAFPVFRMSGCLILLHWFWGISVGYWTRYRVNYIYLFEFNPRLVRTPIMIFNDAVDETLVFLVLMLLYYKAGAHDIPNIAPPGFYALLLLLYTLKRLIFPLEVKKHLWLAIKETLFAPVTPVTFYHSYVGDVFTSMVKVFQDMVWTLCYFASGDFLLPTEDDSSSRNNWQQTIWYRNVIIPLVCLLPLWIRFAQCLRKYTDTGKRWPNLANATKYAMSQTVTLFGAFHPLYLMRENDKYVYDEDGELYEQSTAGFSLFQWFWLGLFLASSLYSYCWDIFMDWGLGKPEHGFLGPRLMFPRRSAYYQAMFIDLFLRSMWVLSLIPPNTGAQFEFPSYLHAVTAALELFRRTMWGFFRLEHEHKSNASGYRRVEFVPLHFSTEIEHKYKKDKERKGAAVLGEVGAVTVVVIAVCAYSITS
eukprot:CAMPEP_0196806948 /NCGR_PEP_ID=MMETSP1362-20130617/6884_1 /TAXON_ID=163516 /ORGANISM="Leptocylindrus danicus, Strain CCMP1856" /LENGTH=831 /DNA_ID=CAMNT_0042180649 /DNA_START=208 /DNA_END=2699 /DNA_ORIENTATION=+